MQKITVLILLTIITLPIIAQDTTQVNEAKTGWNFGLLPVVSYNTDLGLQYGVLTNVYQYGDGSIYPAYFHSIYGEVSRYTKGSGIYRLFYDSKYFIKNIRTTFDISYLPDEALDFYGFNGSQSVLNNGWQTTGDTQYKTRMFYKHKRNILRGKFDFQGKTPFNNLNWAAGFELANYKIGTVDIDKLNKGKDADKMLPDTATLYDLYVDWNIIKPNETKGGFFTSLKAGLVYDTRDNEPNPMKGLWSEVVVAETFGAGFNFTKLAITHRQYFTIVNNRLSFAYRLGYQGVLAGTVPFYFLPNMTFSYLPSSTSDGLGGSKSVRGMVRNRVVGRGVAYGNFELRWQFVHFKFINQNFYLALSPFADFGKVLVEHKFDKSLIPEIIDQSQYFSTKPDKLHITYGGGLHIAMNRNFIIACDLGFPANKQDGEMGLYIGMNWLF